ncbi:MAG: glycosyltransferase, partial [Sphingomicrobium sp.]|nr:hypothetical protein [Sphingomonadales bacterium]
MRRAAPPPDRSYNERPLVLLSSNSLWNVTNFRSEIVNSLAGEGYRIVVAAPGSVAERQSFALPAETEALTLDRSGLNPLKDAALVLRYLRLMRARRPAAYLGWTIKPNIYGALAARVTGVPAILNVSGLG